MRYMVRKSLVGVVGRIWMPSVICFMEKELRPYDIDNMKNEEGKITRKELERWCATNFGDFQEILDITASLEVGDETLDFDFKNEDSMLYAHGGGDDD